MKKFIEPANINTSKTKAIFTAKDFACDIKSLAKEFDVPEDKVYLPDQKHTGRVQVLELDLKPIKVDAVLTKRKGILIGVHVADCVPILLYDAQKAVIGAVHAGWRGTANQILKNTVKTMRDKFRCSAENILVAVGPSIRQCCYNVGDDVNTAVQKATGEGSYHRSQDDKLFVDLSSANVIQAMSSGIPQKNIWQSEECTCCSPLGFYSYRRTKDSAARQGGFIGMYR